MTLDPRAALISVEAERGRRSLSWFIKNAWPVIEQVPFSHNWHIDAISDHLQAVTRGEIRKLLINEPPGSMKSLQVCVFWSAWMWIVNPSLAQLYTSFDSKLTMRDARRVQQLLDSEWFRQRWGNRVRIDPRQPTGDFRSYHGDGREAGGWRFATSVEGKTTGMHPDVKVIDDPTKPKEATKENLEKTWEWYQGTFASRGRNPATVATVCIMQRLAEGDLAARLLESDPSVVHVNIPLEYEPKRAFATKWSADPRTEPGESFWPARFPAPVIESIKAVITDPSVYGAQYQQDPTPGSGVIFDQAWVNAKSWMVLPANGYYAQSWDMTFKGMSTSDYVVGQLWYHAGSEFFLVDQYREKIDFTGAAKAVEDLSRDPLWKKAGAKLIEDKANGSAILSHLGSKVSGLVPVKVDGNAGKVARARAVAPYWKAGNVYLPASAPWLFEFKSELIKFPKGLHDDQVDAMTQALDHFTQGDKPLDYNTAMQRMRELGSI